MESREGVTVGMVEGLESKTQMEDPKVLSDGVRVSEESEVLVLESGGRTLISASGQKIVESGSSEVDDKHDASKNRVVDVTSRKRGWESWGVMDLVGRVLDGKFSMDEEVEDVNDSKNLFEVNLVADTDACRGVIGEPTSENRIVVEGTVVDKDSNNLDSGFPGEGPGLTGNQDLVINETVPDVNFETEAVNNSVRSEVDKDPNKLDSGFPGWGTGLTGNRDSVINEMVPDVKTEIEAVNNVRADVSITERRVGGQTENEGEYYVSDLVWGKVRSHPWWPGQIFAPSAASDKATKYFKKESYLIAYFGDQTFAWSEGSKIKPFGMHFSQMEKQSNADGFCHAVSCALDEVARRFELGLSCRCLPREIHDKINFQEVENAGIRKESSKISGGDNLSSAASFVPGELVEFLKSIAESPKSETDGLQFTVAKAQLLAFNRWKGRYQLPVFEARRGLLGDDTQFTEKGEGEESLEVTEGQRRKSTARDGSSRKRKHPSGDEKWPKIKEKCLSVLMSSSSSKDISYRKKHNNGYPVPNNSRVKRRKNMLLESGEKSFEAEMVPSNIPTADVILSKLILAAKNPMEGHDIISPVLSSFHRQLRNFTCLDKSGSLNAEIDSGKHKGKQLLDLETTNTLGLVGAEDSYWTDRIIQNYSQDQVLFEPKKSANQVEASSGAVIKAGDDKERDAVIVDLDAENPSAPVNKEDPEEHYPTALILNFNNLDSVPPIANLNEIFSRYGPLRESETRILSKSKRAKVIFKRREDADSAFSATGKYEIFGPSLISYSLKYVRSDATSKRNKKKGTSSAV